MVVVNDSQKKENQYNVNLSIFFSGFLNKYQLADSTQVLKISFILYPLIVAKQSRYIGLSMFFCDIFFNVCDETVPFIFRTSNCHQSIKHGQISTSTYLLESWLINPLFPVGIYLGWGER